MTPTVLRATFTFEILTVCSYGSASSHRSLVERNSERAYVRATIVHVPCRHEITPQHSSAVSIALLLLSVKRQYTSSDAASSGCQHSHGLFRH